MDNHSQVLCHLYDTEKEKLYFSWRERLATSNPKLFLTLTFEAPKIRLLKSGSETGLSKTSKSTISTDKAIALTNELLRRIHQRIYKHKKTTMNGYGCLEFQKSGQPHIHLLLENDINPDNVVNAYQRLIKSARKHGKPLPFLKPDSLQATLVNDAVAASAYLTKLFTHVENGERMLIVSNNQVMA